MGGVEEVSPHVQLRGREGEVNEENEEKAER